MHNPHHPQNKRRQDTTRHPQAKRQCTSTTYAIPHHKRLFSTAEYTPNDQPPQKKQRTGPHFRSHNTRGTYHHAARKRPHATLDDHSSPAAPPPTRHRSISRTPRTRTRPYPRRSQYIHDPTDDGDTASSPGPVHSIANQGDNTPDAHSDTMTMTPSPAPNAPPPPLNVGQTPRTAEELQRLPLAQITMEICHHQNMQNATHVYHTTVHIPAEALRERSAPLPPPPQHTVTDGTTPLANRKHPRHG